MKYLGQIGRIFALCVMAEVLHHLIPLPIPASIYGMVLLFACLQLKILRLADVKDAGSFLASLLPVLFVASTVSLVDHWDVLQPALLPLAAILVFPTVLTFLVSGRVTQWMLKKKEEKDHD